MDIFSKKTMQETLFCPSSIGLSTRYKEREKLTFYARHTAARAPVAIKNSYRIQQERVKTFCLSLLSLLTKRTARMSLRSRQKRSAYTKGHPKQSFGQLQWSRRFSLSESQRPTGRRISPSQTESRLVWEADNRAKMQM